MVVVSWLFPRAAHWTLDRDGIQGHFGQTLLPSDEDDEDEEEAAAADDGDDANDEGKQRLGCRAICPTARSIASTCAGDNRRRVVRRRRSSGSPPKARVQTVELDGAGFGGSPKPEQLERYLHLRKRGRGATERATSQRMPCDNGDRPSRTRVRPRTPRAALVSGDRLQPLHELHGVHRLLPVRRVRRRRRGDDPGRAARQLPQRLPGVQPRLSGERDHLPAAQDARPSPAAPTDRPAG